MPTWDKKKTTKKVVKKPVKKPTTSKKPVKSKKIVSKIVDTVNENKLEWQVQENIIDTNVSWEKNKNSVIIVIMIIIALLAALVFLAWWYIIPTTSNLDGKVGQANSKTSNQNDDWIVKKWDKIKVDYIGKLEDWSIFDSSIEEFAKKATDYNKDSWRKYEPLEFTVWAWQMIKWFDEWVLGMKVGEKKTLTIKPADWYWEASILQDVPKKYLGDNIEQDVPESSFRDYITRTVPKEALWEKWKSLKIGEKLEEAGISWEVSEITNSWVTLKIANTDNPFYGKKIVVWAKADYQWNTITIKKIGTEMITVNILNKQSPFYGKKLVEWLVGKLPNWEDAKIEKINWDTVTVSTKNPQKLAGKTLIFDVELKEIVK